MLLKVNPHKIEIDKTPVNEREINISKCTFEFAEEITNDYVKEAYFTFGGTTYKQIIVNDECDFPSEVLVKKGQVKIGVVAYLVENETEIKRYNPSPAYFDTWQGSLKDNAENSEPITPTDKEQIEQAITNLQNDVTDLEESKQDTLVSGENIKTINGESVLGSGNIEVVTDLSDYYTKEEIDESQTAQNVKINANKDDIATLNNNLTNYSLITETGSQIALNINSSNYQMTAVLKDKNGNTIYTSNVIDLPIESMIIDIDYDEATKEIVFTLQSGTTLRVSVADLVSGLVSTDELNTILSNYYTKAEIDTLLNGKQNTLTFDTTPTENSTNPVTSDGIYTSQAVQDANIEENASNIDWLQTLVSQMPTVPGTGTDISLQDVLNYRFMKFVMKGNSSQFSTTGKNLFDVSKIEVGKSWFGGSNNARARYYIAYNPDEAYTISFINIPSEIDSVAVVESSNITDTTGNKYSSTIDTTQPFTHTFNSNAVYLILQFQANTTFTREIANKIVLQLEKGSSATSYEPYTGGIPAPNSSYPYPIKSVTGENGLVLQNENLFDKSNYEYLDNANVSSSSVINIENNFALIYVKLQAGTYTISNDIGSYQWLISDCNEIPAIGTSTSPRQVTTGTSVTYTMNSIGYLLIRVAKNSFSISDFANKLQIVKGSTAPSTYVEHEEQNYQLSLGNIELCKIGDYQDYIYKSGDNWYKREYISKKIFDGTENWSTGGVGTNPYTIAINGLKPSISSGSNPNYVYCNYFRGISYDDRATGGDNTVYSVVGIPARLYFRNTNFADLTSWTNFLQEKYNNSNPVVAIYVKSSYTDIQITDTTLISQLNDIYENAHSYNGVTNITTTYEDGNEQMIIEASALKSWNDSNE